MDLIATSYTGHGQPESNVARGREGLHRISEDRGQDGALKEALERL